MARKRMEAVKETADYTIFKKKTERYAVKNKDGKWISGDEKVKILVEEKLLKVPVPKPKEEEKPEQQAADEKGASEETPAEETPAEEKKTE